MSVRSLLCVMSVACAAFLASGCVHLYNENNDKLAQTASTSVEAIVTNAHAQFQQEATNQNAALTTEIEGVERFATGVRNASITAIVTSDEPLKSVWSEELLPMQLNKLEEGVRTLSTAQARIETFDNRAEEIAGRGYTVTCTLTNSISELNNKATTGPHADEINARYSEAETACSEWRNILIELGKASAPSLFDDLREAGASREGATEVAKGIQEEIQTIRKELKTLQSTSSDEKPSELISDNFRRLNDLLETAGVLGSATGISVLADEQIKAINCVLTSVVTEDPEPAANAGDQESEACLSERGQRFSVVLSAGGVPDVIDAFYSLRESIGQPPLTALIMLKNEAEARKRAADAGVAREAAKIRILEDSYKQFFEEIKNYNEVQRLLNNARKDFSDMSTSIKIRRGGEEDIITDILELNMRELSQISVKDAEDSFLLNRARKGVLAAIALKLYTESLVEKRKFEDSYRLIGIEYDAATAVQRARADQWLALIKPLVDQQKRYHETGVKYEELTGLAVEIAKAAGLIGIAATN